jgi:hypothetical protein
MAVKTRNIINLQRQLDEAFPRRKKPDGWIGNAAHKGHTSGHNPDDTPGSKPAWNGDPDALAEVRDLDISEDLGDGVHGQDLVDHLIKVPGIGQVVRYFIHRGRMYHQRTGFRPEAFDGDPHTDHVHVEGAWSQAADNNASFDFRLEDIAMPSADEISDKWAQDPVVATDTHENYGSRNGVLVTLMRRTEAQAEQIGELTKLVKALAEKIR